MPLVVTTNIAAVPLEEHKKILAASQPFGAKEHKSIRTFTIHPEHIGDLKSPGHPSVYSDFLQDQGYEHGKHYSFHYENPDNARYQIGSRTAAGGQSGGAQYRRPVHIRVYDTHHEDYRGIGSGGAVQEWDNVDSRYTGMRSAHGKALHAARELTTQLNAKHEMEGGKGENTLTRRAREQEERMAARNTRTVTDLPDETSQHSEYGCHISADQAEMIVANTVSRWT